MRSNKNKGRKPAKAKRILKQEKKALDKSKRLPASKTKSRGNNKREKKIIVLVRDVKDMIEEVMGLNIKRLTGKARRKLAKAYDDGLNVKEGS